MQKKYSKSVRDFVEPLADKIGVQFTKPDTADKRLTAKQAQTIELIFDQRYRITDISVDDDPKKGRSFLIVVCKILD